ncbi:MAG: AAA family ATPase [Acidobacteria bacterium]|nr:MAG: AAA family ATPase [Acidobacteriota bacterium]
MAFDKRFNPEELKQFLKSKYGSGVHVEVFPKTEQDQTDQTETPLDARSKALEFNYKPSDIKEYLDRYVIQQDDAKKVLATAVCDHYHHIQNCTTSEDCRDYKKQNIILIGPTGVGKTYLVQNIARLIGVPFVKADATKYSETGYVGGDVEDLIRDLVHQAGGDIQLAEFGIVYLDEIDKIATPTQTIGRDVSGHGVQRGLLKLMEETEVPLRSPTDVASQMQAFMEFQSKGKVEKKTISTKHILFVVSGAFTGLTEIIKRRIGSKQIGFTGERTTADEEHFLFEKARSVDFIDYGFEAEFIGRLPVVVHCNPLSVDDLFRILKYSEGSLLKQYKKDFLAYGLDAYFTDDAMMAVAGRAETERTGARGLMTVCEKLFREYKYRLPDTVVKEFVVDRELVENPTEVLTRLIENPTMHRDRVLQFQLKRFEKVFTDKYGVQVTFTPDAAELIADRAAATSKDLMEYCETLFGGYEHGLNLLRKVSGQTSFVIDRTAVEDPAGTLERWIKETYK